MRNYLIATLVLLVVGTISMTAQISTADSLGIEAISDTTEVIEEPLDNSYGMEFDSLEDLFKSVWKDSMSGVMLPLIGVLLIFFLLPIIVVALILYFIYRNEKRNKELAEKLITSGQQVPASLLPTVLKPREILWRNGISKVSIGLGVAVVLWLIGAKLLAGIGIAVAFYGAGQMVMARTSADKNFKKEEENVEHIYEK